MRVAKLAEFALALTISISYRQVVGIQIVQIVGSEFLQAASRHIHQLDFHFRTSLSVLAALYDILFAGSSRLHHLIYRPVTVSGQETPAKLHCYLIECIAFAVEVKFLPDDRFLQYLAFGIVFHIMLFFQAFLGGPRFF